MPSVWPPAVIAGLATLANFGLRRGPIRQRLTGFDAYFGLPYLIFHYGYLLQVPRGLGPESARLLYDVDLLPRAIAVSTVGLVAFYLGYALLARPALPRPRPVGDTGPLLSAWRTGLVVWGSGQGLLALFMVAAGGLLTFLRLPYGYAIFGQLGVWGKLWGVSGQIGLPGLALLLASHYQLPPSGGRRLITYGCLGASVLIPYAAGHRGGAAVAILVALYLRGQLLRAPKVRWLVALALLGLVATQFMGKARMWRRGDPSIATARAESWASLVDPYEALLMMGSQINAVVRTLSIVPAQRPYGLGESYLAAAQYIVPNPFPTTRVAKLTYGAWLTQYTAPATYATGGGLGASVAAEAYFNFGLPGVLVVLLLVGLASGRLEALATQSKSPWLWAAFAVWFLGWVWSIRNEAPSRTLVWGWSVLFLAWQAAGRRKGLGRRPSG